MPIAAGKNDLTLHIHRIAQDKRMSCWYAAAQMVLAYRDVVMSVVNMGTNLSVLIRYLSDKGLAKSGVLSFAAEVGLNTDQFYFRNGFTQEALGISLGRLGPLWMAGLFPQGGHAVVICAIAGDQVMVADPDGSKPYPRWMPLAEVEAIRSSFNLPVLYRVNGPVR